MKRLIVFWILALSMIIAANAQTTYEEHEIQAGETLYSLSRLYGTTVDEIRNINPDLGEVYKIGQIIRIPKAVEKKVEEPEFKVPDCKATHKVKKKETIYGLSHQYGITIEELVAANPILETKSLKKNMELCIPYSKAEKEAMKPAPKLIRPKAVNIAVILPYGLKQAKKNKEACTMIDFYEGMLLATNELKAQGISANIYAYDEQNIDSILSKPHLKKMHAIVGPKNNVNMIKVTRFCDANNIKAIIPFSSQDNLVNYSKNVFQVNTKNENRHAGVFSHLETITKGSNIVFVDVDAEKGKTAFYTELQKNFTSKSISFKHTTVDDTAFVKNNINAGVNNYIFISSSTQQAFEKLIKRLDSEDLTSRQVSIIGYADWQTFAQKHAAQFSKYNCTFFTSFYNSPNSNATTEFNNKFKESFHRDQYIAYPHFGMLGYDVANFFVRNLFEQGNMFDKNVEGLSTKAIQNPMYFVRKDENSGYINKAMMFINYHSDGSVTIQQFKF